MTKQIAKTHAKSHVAKQTKVASKFNLKPWHIVAGILLFILGGFIIAFSKAATQSSFATGDVIASYSDDSGVLVQSSDGNTIKTLVAPSDYTLSSNGDLFCFDANSDSGTTRKLNPGEINRLQIAMNKLGVVNPPVSEEASKVAVVFKGLTMTNPTTGQTNTYVVLGNSEVPPAFSKAADILKSACAGDTKPITRIQKPRLKNKNNPQVSTPTTSYNVLKALIYSAHAAMQTDWTYKFDDYMAWNINTARSNASIPSYTLYPCLKTASVNWSKTMADAGRIFHDTSLATHNAEANCPSATILGENVGYTGGPYYGESPDITAFKLFTAYMRSQAHRDNILDRSFTYFNVGSAITNDSKLVFNTHRFMTTPIMKK